MAAAFKMRDIHDLLKGDQGDGSRGFLFQIWFTCFWEINRTIFDISLYRIGLLVMALGAILTTTNVLWLVFSGLFFFAFGIFASNTVASNWIANKAPSNKPLNFLVLVWLP